MQPNRDWWERNTWIRKDEHPIKFWLTALYHAGLGAAGAAGVLILIMTVMDLYFGKQIDGDLFTNIWYAAGAVGFVVSLVYLATRKDIPPWYWGGAA